MMENLQKRGVVIGEQRLARTRIDIKSALTEELPGDVQVIETAGGIRVEGRRLKERMVGNSSLRDVAFLMRGVR